MDGGATAALLVLAVLLVGVPRMSRRRAELGSWHAAGRGDAGTAPRAVPLASRAPLLRALPGRRDAAAREVATPAVAGATVLAPGTGLRRATPGARVLVRRSAVPRPRCAPGSSSRPVLAGRPATPLEGSSDLIVVAGTAVETPLEIPLEAPLEAPVATTVAAVPAVAVDGVRAPDVVPARPAGTAPGVPSPRRAPSPRPTAPAGGARPVGRVDGPVRHLVRLGTTAAAALIVGVLAVLGVVPAPAAALLPLLLAADVVVLRRRAVRTRAAARERARRARSAAPTAAVADVAAPAPAAPPAPRTGAVTGLLPSLADLRAAAAADAAPGLRGPATAPRPAPVEEPARPARPARRRRRSA